MLAFWVQKIKMQINVITAVHCQHCFTVILPREIAVICFCWDEVPQAKPVTNSMSSFMSALVNSQPMSGRQWRLLCLSVWGEQKIRCTPSIILIWWLPCNQFVFILSRKDKNSITMITTLLSALSYCDSSQRDTL